MTKDDLRKKRIPDTPGVYFFTKGKKVLYVGKATSLRDRVRSYFSSDLTLARSPLIVDMVEKSSDIKFLATDSVLEALIAEANYIKKYRPKYNTDEKDNKSFNFVVITDEDFPRVMIVRERNLVTGLNGVTTISEFGPYTQSASLKEALNILRKIFPFRDAKAGKKHSDRFYLQLGLAPNILGEDARKKYQKTIRHIKLFFEGKKKALIKELEKEMKTLAKEKKFEEAGEYKRKIFALNHIQDVALIKEELRANSKSVEAFDVAHMSGDSRVGVMVVVSDGVPEKSRYRKFIIKSGAGNNDIEALREILDRRLAHPEWGNPAIFVIDGGKAQKNMAEKLLRDRGVEIPVASVVKDQYHRPREILGEENIKNKYERDILLANSEAHRFAIAFHREKMRKRAFQG